MCAIINTYLPHSFWVDAHLTAIYLINYLPSHVTNNSSPYHLTKHYLTMTLNPSILCISNSEARTVRKWFFCVIGKNKNQLDPIKEFHRKMKINWKKLGISARKKKGPKPWEKWELPMGTRGFLMRFFSSASSQNSGLAASIFSIQATVEDYFRSRRLSDDMDISYPSRKSNWGWT